MRILADSAKYKRLGIISICVLSIMLSGCGKKLFPKPKGGAPPPQINDLKAQVMPRMVELSWSPVTAGARGITYSIMRSELRWENRNCLECPPPDQQQVKSIDASAANVTPAGKLQWADADVSYRRAFRYQIAVVDEKGNRLSLSNPAIAKVYPGPAAPLDVTAATQPHGILIQWKPVLKDLEGNKLDVSSVSFRVERLSGARVWEKALPSPVKGNSYYDQAIASGQNYSYRIIPVLYIDEATIFGEPSSTVLVKAPEAMAPPPPDRVWATPVRRDLEIHWTERDGENAGYHIYRKEGKEIIRLTATPIQHPPFVDQGARKGTVHFYAVSAVSSGPDHKEGLLSKWIEVRSLLAE